MKFSVLAIDFDGTTARADVLDPDVRAAIGELRAQGIVVILATGRILEDLRRVAGDLHFVDAVVAENGAVVEFPDSGYSTVTGEPPRESLLAALRQEGIRFDAGSVVVEADAGDAARILAIVRRLELPLVIAFNRGRLMVLPQTISKATGVRLALTILRLSPHNAVAIGDAENDHELLRACEVGVAVGWGSEALKASADYVLPGDGPPAVAAYVRGLANRRRVPAPLQTRRRLLLGHADDGQPLALAVRGRNMLVAGDPKSGKSWVTGLLCEQLILYGYCLCVLDPEGDYVSLEALPGVVVFGGANPLPRPMDLLRALRHADMSIVIDLSHASHDEKVDYLRTVLPALATLRHHTGLPHRIIVDEAHYFLHDVDVSGLLDLELNGYTLVSYRASRLHRDVLTASQAIVVTRESDPHEVRALFALCQSCQGRRSEPEWEELLGGLAIGEAVVLPVTEEAQGEIRRIHLKPRLTPHVRHLAKYIDIPVSEGRAFVLWRDGSMTDDRARTLRDLVGLFERSPVSALDGHLRRRDFSRWIGDVFGDYPLAKTVRQLEQDYLSGTVADLPAALAQAVRSRYEFLEPVLSPPSGSRPGGPLH
jgi:hydroxymethylpyrimidine pyrophosphatase-like HAD family hydrolase